MAVEVAIIVTDAPPLITLAAAQSLDYLLYPLLPVIIPDAHRAAFRSAGLSMRQQCRSGSIADRQDTIDRERPAGTRCRADPFSLRP